MVTKVLCVYHTNAPQKIRPSMLKYPDIFVPILGGAEDYKLGSSALFDLFTKDDDGDNISKLNLRFNEHTCLYWAYKHYREIGNLDMIGLCHYRRFMDVDYYNLNPSCIYLRRTPGSHPEFSHMLVLLLSGVSMTQLVLDEFLYNMPEYKTATELTLSSIRFFDKNMFIMSREMYMKFMEYMMKCYRLILSNQIINNLVKWHDTRKNQCTTRCIERRGFSYLLEIFSAIYFQYLQLQNYPIIVATCTEDSFNGY